MTTPWARRAWRRVVPIAVVLSLAAAGAAFADGGTSTNEARSTTWGHVYTTQQGDCLWLNIFIATSSPGGGSSYPYGQGYPQIETYDSIDGYLPGLATKSSEPLAPGDPKAGGTACGNTSRQVLPSNMYVQENLAHWVSWLNNGAGAWAWCNQGPWVGNQYKSHEVVTGYTWRIPPCTDQDPNYNTYYYLQGRIQANVVNSGWVGPFGTNTSWINAHF